MARKKITDYVAAWMEEFAKDHPYELSRCEFIKEADTWYLRVYVDKLEEEGYGYMSSDDCETVSRFLSARLDEEDPIAQNYYLEVSSPGLDRPLLCEKDFIRFTGSLVEVKLYKAVNGKKSFQGELISYENGQVTIKTGEEELSFSQKDAAKINLAVVV